MRHKTKQLALALALTCALLTGCSGTPKSGGEDVNVDLEQFSQDIAQRYDTQAGLGPLDEDLRDTFFPGLSEISTEQLVGFVSMMTMSSTEFLFVEVTNEEDVPAVQNLLQGRIDAQVGTDDMPGGAWYPASIQAWKENSQVLTRGNYVLLIVHPEHEAIAQDFNALF